MTTEKRFRDAADSSGNVVAFPVVAPIAVDPEWRPPAPKTGKQLIDYEDRTQFAPEDSEPVQGKYRWLCTLSNGQTVQIDRGTMVIGRSRMCDIVISSAKISRQHAKLSFINGKLWIEDLGSANGVWHNGDKIEQAKTVGNGDVYTISDETLLFEIQ